MAEEEQFLLMRDVREYFSFDPFQSPFLLVGYSSLQNGTGRDVSV